jgi:hypothetical protein
MREECIEAKGMTQMEIDVTRLITELEPSEISGSRAERGINAAQETWSNARAAVSDPLMTDAERAETRIWAKGFGAWDDDEIAAWQSDEVDALVLQYAAGDLRTLQDICPGDGLGDIDWTEAEELAQAGTVGGCLYANGGNLYIYIGD